MALIDDPMNLAQELLPELIDLRRTIHLSPELGLDLPKTQSVVLDAIDGLGLEVRTGDRLSSVVADLVGAQPGPTILLRGDMDALPDARGHRTRLRQRPRRGHARLWSRRTHVDARRGGPGARRPAVHARRAGPVHVPARRGGHRRRRAHDRPGRASTASTPRSRSTSHRTSGRGWSPTGPGRPWRRPTRSTSPSTGRGGHASTPHWASDPMPVACEIVLALQSMITRTVDVFDPAVLTIAHIRGGHHEQRDPRVA